MFSDFEIRRLINHVDRRWKEISLMKDEGRRIEEKTRFLNRMAEINRSIYLILHHRDDPFEFREERTEIT